jgi:peptide deformylase
MAILRILQYPDPLLRRQAYQVSDVKAKVTQAIIDDMIETLFAAKNCMALAATQLAIEVPPQITVINEPTAKGGVWCLINPEIIEATGNSRDAEGCMSVPLVARSVVARAEQVKVRALDREGNPLEISAQDYFARCLQHEIDHLKGVLYIDKLSSLKRSIIIRKLEKMKDR